MKISTADLIALQQDVAAESFPEFVRMSWPVIEPGERYVHNWHMDAIGDHLQAVASGQITRLLVNVPPGTSKSSATCVFFPAWLWGPFGAPHMRFIGAAHEQTLATRDNRRTRLLVESEWFQARWPIRLTSDQNEKTYFENEARGFRQSTAVASMTGKRGHVVVWDDPINPEQANSQLVRETAIRIFTETLPSRLVSPAKSAIIVIMQRLHQNDVSGHILANDLGYTHLCLPMEFEPERRCRTLIGFEDPRTEPGELLFPERFPREVVERDKKVMGAFATAGQFQQRPVPRGGGLFKRSWFEIVDTEPVGCTYARGWDLAATKGAGDWTAGVKIARDRAGTFYICDVRREQGSPGEVARLLRATASEDGMTCKGSLPQDPGQAGKSQVQFLLKSLAPFPYRATPESGAKETRAAGLAGQAEQGNVKVVRGAWNRAFLDEIEAFPMGVNDDQVDAASRAFFTLALSSGYSLDGVL